MVGNIVLTSHVMPRTQRLRAWSAFVLVAGLLIVSEFVGYASPFRRWGEGWWRFWTGRANQVTMIITQPFISIRSLQTSQRRVRDLELQYAQTLAQLTELEQLRQENQSLRSLLGSSTEVSQRGRITGPIIAYGRPLIGVGVQDQVHPGMMVLVADTLIGIVTEVSEKQSQVALLSQENVPQVLAKTETGITGIVRGNGQRVIMTEVPIEQHVAVGQRVVTQGQDGIAPNILIGTVAEVKAEPTSAVQTIVVEQIVSFYETSILEVR